MHKSPCVVKIVSTFIMMLNLYQFNGWKHLYKLVLEVVALLSSLF